MSLGQSAASGVKWSSVSQIGRQAVQFVTIAILARLLTPADFGLLGMAGVVIGFLELFKDMGTSAAVIQRKDSSDLLLYSIFWVNVIFGLFIVVLLFVVAPVAARFYREPRIAPLIQVLSIAFLISSVSTLQQAIWEREMAFQKLAKVEISAVVTGSIVGIISALLGIGVWSLVFQSLTVVTVTSALLWAFSDFRPKMSFCWPEVRALSNYSLNLTGFNVLNYIARNADYLLIGRFLGAQNLGYYSLAYRIMLFPLQNVSGVIRRVMFPVYSQFQDDDARFRLAYLKVVGAIAIVTFPMMLGLMVLTEPFVLAVFGSQWAPVSLLLIIFAPLGMSQSISTTAGTIYQAKGRTDWLFRWGIVAGVLVIVAFAIGLQWGIIGIAVAYALWELVLFYPAFAIPFKLINLPIRHLAHVLWRQLVCSVLMMVVVLFLRFILPAGLGNGWILGILVPIGCLIYLLLSWLINREQVCEVVRLIRVRG